MEITVGHGMACLEPWSRVPDGRSQSWALAPHYMVALPNFTLSIHSISIHSVMLRPIRSISISLCL